MGVIKTVKPGNFPNNTITEETFRAWNLAFISDQFIWALVFQTLSNYAVRSETVVPKIPESSVVTVLVLPNKSISYAAWL